MKSITSSNKGRKQLEDEVLKAIRENNEQGFAHLLRDLPKIDYSTIHRELMRVSHSHLGMREIWTRTLLKIHVNPDIDDPCTFEQLLKEERQLGTNMALHLAVSQNNPVVVADLLHAGANPFLVDAYHRRPVDLFSNRDIHRMLTEAMSAKKDSFMAALQELDSQRLLILIPEAKMMDMIGELQQALAVKLDGPGREQFITDGQNLVKSIASMGVPAILEQLLLAIPGIDINDYRPGEPSALSNAAFSADLESVVLLMERGARYSLELFNNIKLMAQNKQFGDNSRLISIIEYMLSRPERLVQVAKPVEPAAVTMRFRDYEHPLYNPTTGFGHPIEYDNLANGYDEVNWAIMSPITNIFRRLVGMEPEIRRMPFPSLAQALQRYVTLYLYETDWNRRTLAAASAVLRNATSSADKLMTVFAMLAIYPSAQAGTYLRTISNSSNTYDHLLAQYRLAWKDFIILVKTNELATQGITQLLREQPGLQISRTPWLSIEAIEGSEVEEMRWSTLRINHAARIAKAALAEARAWYVGFDDRFYGALNEEQRAYMQEGDALWKAVEGVPNLQILCQRQLLKSTELKAPHVWCSIFNRMPASASSQPVFAGSSSDEEGRPTGGYIGSSSGM